MKCNWTKRAFAEYQKVVQYIADEFGTNAAIDFILKMEACDERLCGYPDMGIVEPLLKDRKRYNYHSHTIDKLCKIIYTIDKQGKITITDLWDTRREPRALTLRIKR